MSSRFSFKLELIDDHYCFACGADNPDGLGVDWVVEGRACHGVFTPKRKFQGWKGMVHGGILAALLDEAMTRLAWIACGGAMTAEMTVRFLQPALTQDKIFAAGEIISENRKIVGMRAFLHKNTLSGALIARSTGKAFKMGKK